tara:strand:+ start:7646 stop:7891 length:246 start_codon:yes stop_codon:yes gene_type:complete
MNAKIINVIGPYDGPYDFNILTYKLKLKDGSIIAWHENGKRGFPKLFANTIIDGLILNKNKKRPDYKNSIIKEKFKQTLLF